MAANSVMLRARGLHTYYNPLSEIPEGAMLEADNVVIDRNGIVEPRRGFAKFGSEFTATPSSRAEQLFIYKNRVLVHDSANELHYDGTGSGSFSTFSGLYNSPSEYRIKGIESNGNFYFITDNGLKKIAATDAGDFTTSSGYIVNAGAAKALDLIGQLAGDASGFLLDDSKTAYRVVWGYKDINNNLILGSPSNRLEIENTTGLSDNVELTFQIPTIIGATNPQNYFYQVYRTGVFTGTPVIPTPDEEYNLVIEEFPTSGQLTAGEVTLDDITPDSIREGRTLLYINAVSGEGIENANETPPLAKDITSYKGYTFLANTKTVQRLTITMLAGDATLNTYDLIIDDGTSTETYSFVATKTVAFEVETSTTGFPEIDIDVTARNLVNEINKESSMVYAYYDSGANDTPGIIRLERQNISDDYFFLNVSDSAISQKFIPEIATSGENVASDNEIKPNRIYFSKYQQPEAYPLVNYIDVGGQDAPIQRIIGLRDSLFIFKTDGIYRLSGDVSPFQVAPFDTSAAIVAPDSAVVLNNQIYAISTQGIITVTDTGVSIISRPIENRVFEVIDNPNFDTLCFGVSYETDRAYHIWMPSGPSNGEASQCFRFNTFTNTWVRWPISKKCGIVNPTTDRMYLGTSDEDFIEEERKSRSRTDYADRTANYTILVDSIDAPTLTMTLNSVAGLLAGDTLVQTQYLSIAEFNRVLHRLDADPLVADSNYHATLEFIDGEDPQAKIIALAAKLDADSGVALSTYGTLIVSGASFPGVQTDFNSILAQLDGDSGVFYTDYVTKFASSGTIEYESVIKSIDKINNKVVLYLQNPFQGGAVVAHKAIQTRVTWAPQVLGNPTTFKQVREGTVLVQDNNFTSAKVAYSSDLSGSFNEISFTRKGIGDFGQFQFGENAWGGLSAPIPFRTLVPANKQRCRYMNCRFQHQVAREAVVLYGINLIYREYSNRAYR